MTISWPSGPTNPSGTVAFLRRCAKGPLLAAAPSAAPAAQQHRQHRRRQLRRAPPAARQSCGGGLCSAQSLMNATRSVSVGEDGLDGRTEGVVGMDSASACGDWLETKCRVPISTGSANSGAFSPPSLKGSGGVMYSSPHQAATPKKIKTASKQNALAFRCMIHFQSLSMVKTPIQKAVPRESLSREAWSRRSVRTQF